jgi:hypothetical protein
MVVVVGHLPVVEAGIIDFLAHPSLALDDRRLAVIALFPFAHDHFSSPERCPAGSARFEPESGSSRLSTVANLEAKRK